MKVLFNRWAPICARLGGRSDGGRPVMALSPPVAGLPLTPITSTRVAPRCNAGLMGAWERTAPSPKYSRLIRTGGNSSGIAALASRCRSSRRVECPGADGVPRDRWSRAPGRRSPPAPTRSRTRSPPPRATGAGAPPHESRKNPAHVPAAHATAGCPATPPAPAAPGRAGYGRGSARPGGSRPASRCDRHVRCGIPQTAVRRWIAWRNCRAPQARPTALMAPAEVPTMTGKGLPALSGSRSAMAARTPTW